MRVNPDRIRDCRTQKIRPLLPSFDATGDSPVVYCMNRDQRVRDNWALLYAQHAALELHRPLHVVLCYDPIESSVAHAAKDFFEGGFIELQQALQLLNIAFTVVRGDRSELLTRYLHQTNACFLVADFEPLRQTAQWLDRVANEIVLPIHQVDAHNIVPCWIASSKLEFAAHTIRPKLMKHLPEFLDEPPKLERHPFGNASELGSTVTKRISKQDVIMPGELAAHKRLKKFLSSIEEYALRNDPTKNAQSGLSPYLHFGHISAQRIALEVEKLSSVHTEVKEKFLDELIVRRELSDNFTFYNDQYDSFSGFPAWAQRTLNAHRTDVREYMYEYEDWESARTHDGLWNAAQLELVTTGKLHGYMRMYWAKKLLEWSSSPEVALATAIGLNDTYELDGCDPNGYAGIAWSIGGVHDRPWFERPVYGSVRYMNANGCARKFDVNTYIRTYA